MSTPTSAIARMASDLTRVASVPALCASKRFLARWRSRPSAIWLRAELWVHRNSTRPRAPSSAAAGILSSLRRSEQEVSHRVGEKGIRAVPVKGVEAPLPPLLLAYQPGVL